MQRRRFRPPSLLLRETPNLPFHQQDLLSFVNLREFDLDYLIHSSLHITSDKCGFHRNLPVPAIDQHAELHPARASMLEESIQSGAGRPACKEHIVDQHDIFVANVESDFFLLHDRFRTERR